MHSLEWKMEPVGILILVIFIFTMIIILSEKINETATALFAMCLSVGFLILTDRMNFEAFILLIEWDTILFVTAMMIVVSISASSGVFQYIALHLAQRTGGEPKSVFTSFMAFVFVISLFFDPLPTMLIMGPLTVEVCRAIDMDYRVLLISQVIISNFASFPSIVGSVSNLVISSWANIEAGYLFLALLPLSLLLFPITMVILSKYYSAELAHKELDTGNPLMMIRPSMMIKSRRDFYMSSIGMGILFVGLVIGPQMRLEAAFLALTIASAMLIFSEKRVTKFLRELSWDTIFFLIGLFGIIAAMEVTGLIDEMVLGLQNIVAGNVFAAMLFMLWVPGLVLAPIDNIPVAALLSPLAVEFGGVNSPVPLSLIIGTNIGGYIIPFGDAPNMIALTLAADAGNEIDRWEFTKVAFILGILHLFISTAYCFLLAWLL
ncbi:hypothetical protein EU537_00585 [Candidatus Thorarchaeota archaeon]|nr:MAG: hypothetical protein EU537_00585 [Candidatus Thorarchaeota archaeon]